MEREEGEDGDEAEHETDRFTRPSRSRDRGRRGIAALSALNRLTATKGSGGAAHKTTAGDGDGSRDSGKPRKGRRMSALVEVLQEKTQGPGAARTRKRRDFEHNGLSAQMLDVRERMLNVAKIQVCPHRTQRLCAPHGLYTWLHMDRNA